MSDKPVKVVTHDASLDVPRRTPDADPKERPARKPSAPAEPSTLELAANFGSAVGRWATAGFPVVDAATYAARAEACDGCRFWDGKARLGLGKCSAPGCGCTSLKRWLKTERCPHPEGSRWPA